MKPVTIIGMGLAPEDLTVRHKEIISDADILMGGERHLAFFEDAPMEKVVITKDLKRALAFIRSNMGEKRIVMLASGDPLFFGIGAYMAKALGSENVEIMPNISSIAAAFARIKEPWGTATVISLHGRDNEEELFRVLGNLKGEDDRVAVFTDRNHTPSWLANILLNKGIIRFMMGVFEQLGTDAERVGWYALRDAAVFEFQEPNVLILKPQKPFAADENRTAEMPLTMGMDENDFSHEQGLITKSEIRAVSISKLRLLPHHTLWDLGAGSGSIGVEASLLLHGGSVFSVERQPERVAQIEKNVARFGVDHLKVVRADLPEGMDALPDPDRVFVGGGGKKLPEIIKGAAKRLKPNGIIVINVVLMDNVGSALNILKNEGLQTELVQVQINRTRKMPWSERLEAQNPVWIIQGERKD